jgi:hypothetical protein
MVAHATVSARLSLFAQSSHPTVVAPTGVTGPSVLAAARGCFIVAPVATPGAVTGVGDPDDTNGSLAGVATGEGR